MVRRYFGIALIVAIWLVVLSVPSLRLMPQIQLQRSHMSGMLVGWCGFWSEFRPQPHSYRPLSARYPNDPRVQAKVLEWDNLPQQVHESEDEILSRGKALTQGYDQLLQRFPDNLWLIANRLRFTCLWFKDDRLASDWDKPVSGYHPESEKKTFTPVELAQAIAVAEKGRRLEPDNCYFDWMLAYFLFAGYRDKEALAVLHGGAQKPRYDDYVHKDLQISVAVCELMRPLLSEEKVIIAESLAAPHFKAPHRTSRLAVRKGVQAERAGDHQRALQLYADVARLGGRMEEGNHHQIGVLVGTAIQARAWAGLTRQSTKEEKEADRENPSASYKRQSKKFANYAAAHGRADLAKEALREGEKAAQLREQISRYQRNRDWDTDVSSMGCPYTTVVALWWASVALFPHLLLNAALWLALLFVLWRKPADGERIRFLDSISSVVVCVLLPLLLLTGFALSLRFLGTLGAGAHIAETAIASNGLIWAVIFALLSACFCAGVTQWRHRKASVQLSPKKPSTAPTMDALTTLIKHRNPKPLLSAIGIYALPFAAAVSWISFGIDSSNSVSLCLLVLFSLLSIAQWVVRWSWFTPTQFRLITGYGLCWYRQTLGAFMVLCTLCYLILSLASLAPRRELDAKMDAIIQHGEMAVLLKNDR